MPAAGGESFDEVRRELEALKLRLASMEDFDLAEAEGKALAAEISAIRLHLKRLDFEREAAAEAYRRALGEPSR
jgi:hypothetical protein